MGNIRQYFQEARARAKRRKSPWNLILIPFSIGGIGFSYFIQFQILWFIHTLMYPNHSGRLKEFWKEGLSGNAFVSSFLLAIPIFFSSLALGMIIANISTLCIPPAQKTFDKEAQGIRGVSFNEAMKRLGKITIYLVPICFILGFIGAATLKTLR